MVFLKVTAILSAVLVTLTLSVYVPAAEINVRPTQKACPNIKQAVAEIVAVPFPRGWTIVIACTENDWQAAQRKADALATKTAFTDGKSAITVVHGTIFANAPLRRSIRQILLRDRTYSV